MARTFDAKRDALELASPLADLATRIGQRKDALRLEGEVAILRAIVEQTIVVYTRQFAAYEAAVEANPHEAHMLAPPSTQEMINALEALRKMQDTYVKTLNRHSIPKEVVIALVHRVRHIVQQQVPDAERQQALLKTIGQIQLPY